ncbi:MAG: hypothetical protein GWO85_00145 [Simkaniaceae bacterium]|nr:hypothetical protein [Simkaniaceae bacterium]
MLPIRQKRILTILSLALLFISCKSDEKNISELTIAYPADIRGFDPSTATDFRSGRTMSFVYDNLVRFDVGTELVPCLAKAWDISENGRKYTFYLRRDARFFDGNPITAQDAVYSLTRILLPETASPQTWLFDRIVGAKDVIAGKTDTVSGLVAENDSTLVIRIVAPFAPFIQYLAMPSAAIVNYRQIENINVQPAGSGPWKLESWERDGEIIFVCNESYWGKNTKMSRLRIRILSEPMTRSAEFEAGNLDILDVPNVEVRAWQNHPRWGKYFYTEDDLSLYYVGMNCSRPPFNDIRLRKAMNLAVDREKIIEVLRFGVGIPASGPVPPSLLKGPPPDPYPYDPEEALRLLDEAGFPQGFETKLWVAGDAEMYHVLEAIQSYWQAVGIRVELLRSDWNVFRTAVKAGKPDLYYLSWFADYPDGENFLYPLFHSQESMVKRNRFSNAEIDSLIERIQALIASPERDSLIARTNKRVFEEAPWVFLWYPESNVVIQPWLKGFVSKLIFNAQRYDEWYKKF